MNVPPEQRAALTELEAMRPETFRGASSAYSRFIVLGSPRTGSNLLISLLSSSGRVTCFGELLADEFVGFDAPAFSGLSKQRLQQAIESTPLAFLEGLVFGGHPEAIEAVGFKVFYDQVERPRNRALWQALLADPTVRVVHLKRSNLLEQALSFVLAQKTGRWRSDRAVPDGAGDSARTVVTIEPGWLTAFFEQRVRDAERFRRVLGSHPVLELDYESLATDRDATSRECLAFLGVSAPDRLTLSSPQKKLNTRSPREVVGNWDELAAAFTDTPWAGFFATTGT